VRRRSVDRSAVGGESIETVAAAERRLELGGLGS
jgi:hypothetical protein